MRKYEGLIGYVFEIQTNYPDEISRPEEHAESEERIWLAYQGRGDRREAQLILNDEIRL